MNQDIVRGAASRARSLAVLAKFGGATRAHPETVAAEEAGPSQYISWLTTSAAMAGWRDKEVGDWPGSKPGDLEFVLQARRKTDDVRGGPFQPVVARLSDAAAGVATALGRAAAEARRGRRAEVVFRPIGETPLLLIDDLKPEHLKLFQDWSGVAVLETSPGNLQASLMASRPLRSFEAVAVQRALARRCGLTLAAVQQAQLRRFDGSVNHKKSLAEPFVTRLFCSPVTGTMGDGHLAELLEEDKAHKAGKGAGPAATTTENVPTPKPVGNGGASSPPSAKPSLPTGGIDDSGSGKDWAWACDQLGRAGGRDRAKLIADLVARCEARGRQGKAATDEDHQRYAELTVDNAMAYMASKRM